MKTYMYLYHGVQYIEADTQEEAEEKLNEMIKALNITIDDLKIYNGED